MYAAYNQSIEAIEGFIPLGKFTAGQSADGALVFNAPLDHLVWTDAMALIVDEATAIAGNAKKKLWTLGGVSKTARDALVARGWQVHDEATLISVW